MKTLTLRAAAPAIILIAAASAGATTLVATNRPARASRTSPAPETRVSTDTFTLDLPAGWSEAGTEARADRSTAYAFTNLDGRYFHVLVWESGQACCEYAADATWPLHENPAATGYVVAERSAMCAVALSDVEGFCPGDDGKLQLYALAKDADGSQIPNTLGGHEFQFEFGSTRAEVGVDTNDFTSMIESLRAK